VRKFPFYKQLDLQDCGPTCLRIIARHYGRIFSREYLTEKAGLTREGVSLSGIAESAEAIGFHSLPVSIPFEMLASEVSLPCIVFWRQRHFVVVYKIKKNKIYVADPAYGLITYTKSEFLKSWIPKKSSQNIELEEGIVLVLEPTPLFYESRDDEQPEKKMSIRSLYSYLSPFRRYIIQLFIGLLIGSFIQLLIPFLAQSMIDNGINHNNLNFVYLVLIAQLVLFISRTSVEIIRNWLLLHITSRININLISDFLIKLMRLPMKFFDSKTTGDLLQRIQDHNRIQTFISNSTLNILFSFINVLVFGGVLFFYSKLIFFTFLTIAVIYIAWILLFTKRRADLDFKRFDQASGNQSSLIQLINGMQEIKLNGSERRRRWEWELIQVRLFKLSTKSLSLTLKQNIGGTFLLELMNILITFIAARQVIAGELSFGMLISIQYIIGQLNLPITNFLTFFQTSQDARLSLERLGEIRQREDEDGKNENLIRELPQTKDIIIQNLSFRYGGKDSPLVLKNVNLTIPEGKVTAIVGASGSGKTTLLKLLLKFYEPTEGCININSWNLSNFNSTFWRRKCGIVMQDGFIFADTIARNITESDVEGYIQRERLLLAAKTANIDEYIESIPTGYKTRIGSAGINLSGGQKQRILIARAVYKDPEFIFLDEATSSLDANNEKIIMQNMEEFYRNKTVIIVAHRLSTVKNADQIIVLEKGEIIENGNHKTLTEIKGQYFSLIKNQLELGQ
jgi:ATP-binding cassette, subfamily B, bacterial